MQVLKLAALALAAAAVADAATTTTAPVSTTATSTSTTSTSTTSSTTSTTSTTAAGSSSGSTTATTGSVSCVFRYSMPTATNVPSEVAAAGSSSKKTTGSSSSDSSSSGSLSAVGSTDGSSATAGTVTTPGDGSDGSDGSDAGESASASGSDSTTKTPTSTTKTPTSTTKTPSTTTATPTSTTATPTSTTKTPTATTKTPTTTTATPTTDSSATDDTRRRLMGAVAEAGAATTTNSTASTTTAPSSSNSTSTTTSTTTTTAPSTAAASSSGSSEGSWSSSASASSWSSSSTSSSATSTTTTVEFSCDATFYGAWAKMGLTCGDSALDVDAAAAQTQCLIYSGTADGTGVTDLKTCLSVCRFPGCANGTWDYAADDGINSDIYADLDLLSLLTYAGESAAVSGAVSQPFSNLTMTAETECDYTSDSSFSACQCDNYVYSSTSSSSTAGTSGTASNSYTVPEDKGLEDSDHWADGTTKTTVDKAGIATSTIGSSAATVSVVAGGVMSVASGVVGGTSAGVASGVSAAASVGITMAAVDLCQFSIMINQMNVDARPRFLEKMGKKMAPAGFQFLPFGKVSSSDNSTDGSGSSSSSASTSGSGTRRRLGSSSTSASGSSSSGSGSSSSTSVQGMEKYAALIGVQADKLFYLTVAGIGCLIGALFACYGLFMLAAYSFVSDFPAFSKKWFDKAIGVLMMILILSEYVIGATAMYQICYCIDNDSIDVSFGLAIIALLVMAFGTILFGVLVIRNNEEELRDLGTKDHFDKKFHARFGPLYDEYSFEGRFFFAPKLMLALLCGMTTGMVWIQGLWQIIVLIGFHIAFLFYLEMKQPYPTAFVQKTSSFVIIIKISALFLSFFLLSSATSFNEDIPDDLREGVGFAIVGLQVLVLVALMIRQMYIFYRTWKLKRDGASADDDKAGTTVVTANNRDGNTDPFFSLGEPQYGHANQQQQQQQQYGQANQQQQQQQYGQPGRENSVAILGDDARGQYASGGDQFEQQQQAQYQYQPGKLRGLQPPTGRRTASVVVHDGPGGYRSNEVSL